MSTTVEELIKLRGKQTHDTSRKIVGGFIHMVKVGAYPFEYMLAISNRIRQEVASQEWSVGMREKVVALREVERIFKSRA